MTLWRDCAIKQWAGVVTDYFKPRLSRNINILKERNLNRKTFSTIFSEVEELVFTFSTKIYSDITKGWCYLIFDLASCQFLFKNTF